MTTANTTNDSYNTSIDDDSWVTEQALVSGKPIKFRDIAKGIYRVTPLKQFMSLMSGKPVLIAALTNNKTDETSCVFMPTAYASKLTVLCGGIGHIHALKYNGKKPSDDKAKEYEVFDYLLKRLEGNPVVLVETIVPGKTAKYATTSVVSKPSMSTMTAQEIYDNDC